MHYMHAVLGLLYMHTAIPSICIYHNQLKPSSAGT